MQTYSMFYRLASSLFPKYSIVSQIHVLRQFKTLCSKTSISRPFKMLCSKTRDCVIYRENLNLCKAVTYFCEQKRGNRIGLHQSSTHETGTDLRGIGRILTTDAALALRLANENGYLSWCRNSYLCTAAGVMMSSATINSISAQYAASGALMVALLNLLVGSLSYSFMLLSNRHIMKMSLMSTLLYLSFTIIHLCAWTIVVILYLGYPDDELVTAIELEANEPEGQRQA